VSHALADEEVRMAAAVGVDVLAHTPVEALGDADAWRGRAVISTLAAFGGSRATIDNLRRLRAAGAVVLYGTDLGNTRDAGVSRGEIDLLLEAGLDGQAIVEAGHAGARGVLGPARRSTCARCRTTCDAIGECDEEAPPNSFEPEIQWTWTGQASRTAS
jgi:hypothetical protein